MSDNNVTIDSEDEAFQSADEGDMDDGPKLESSAKFIEEDRQAEGKDKLCDNLTKASEDASGSMENLDIAEDEVSMNETKNDDTKSQNIESQVVEAADDFVKEEESKENEEHAVSSTTPECTNTEDNISTVTTEDNATKLDASSGNEDSRVADASDQVSDGVIDSDAVTQSPEAQAMDRLGAAVEQPAGNSDEIGLESASSEPSTSSAGWGWGGWGNMISKATSSVSSMLETVETQLGIPNPVQMENIVTEGDSEEKSNQDKKQEKSQSVEEARKESAETSETQESDKPDEAKNAAEASAGSGIGSWFSVLGVSQISTMVQNTGKDFVSGSLDALEFVGKKTIDVISKGDPGFRSKRSTLSQAIREAKERAENKEAAKTGDVEEEAITFSVEFDRFQGLAHLEALEMISHESEADIDKILSACSEEARKDNEDLFKVVKKKFEEAIGDDESEANEDVEKFEEIINEEISVLSLNVTASKLLASYSSTKNVNAEQTDAVAAKDVHSQAVTDFAEMTARSVELFHKIGELLLLPDVKASFLVKSRADSLRKICKTLKCYITFLSTRYAARLNDMGGEQSDDNAISKFITDVYLEASNSATHIEDSYRLLLPIFLFTAIR